MGHGVNLCQYHFASLRSYGLFFLFVFNQYIGHACNYFVGVFYLEARYTCLEVLLESSPITTLFLWSQVEGAVEAHLKFTISLDLELFHILIFSKIILLNELTLSEVP